MGRGEPPRHRPRRTLRDGVTRRRSGLVELRVHLREDAGLRFAFEGELFELEDQRNWTDASFKTYPTPVALSDPRPMTAENAWCNG